MRKIIVALMLGIFMLSLASAATTPTLWYKFDEASGTVAVENISGVYNLTGLSYNGWGTGKFGGAYTNNGTTKSLLGYNISTIGNSNALTINFYMKRIADVTDGGYLFDNTFSVSAPPNGSISIENSGNNATFLLNEGGGDSNNKFIRINNTPLNEWVMYTYLANSSTFQVYVNGVLNQSIALSGNFKINGNNATFFGSNSPDPNSFYFHNYTVDEFKLYNVSLSPSEIANLYTRCNLFYSGVKYPTLCPANYPLNSYTNSINYATTGNYDFVYSSDGGVTNNTVTIPLNSNNSAIFNFVNDTANLNQTLNWAYTVFENSRTFNATTTSTNNEGFILNLSYSPLDWLDSGAVLYYNGVPYTTTKTSSGGNAAFSTTFSVPNALTQTSYSFYWNVSLINSTGTSYYISPVSTQTVSPLQNITVSTSCGAGYTPAMFFNFGAEQNLTAFNASISYNIQYGTGNSTALIAKGNMTNIANFSLCINSTFINYTVGYGEIDYSATGYAPRKFFIFPTTRLTTVQASNTLYLLETSVAQPYTITTKSTTLAPYSNAYVALLRWYPSLNQYVVVDMARTDGSGIGVVQTQLNSATYRIGLYDSSGNLIKLDSPTSLTCATSPCNYNLLVSSAENFIASLSIQSNLSFDNSTGVPRFIFIWNDPTQTTTLMNLTVLQLTGLGEVVICSSSASGWTGALACNIGNVTGNVKAVVYRSASPEQPFSSLSWSVLTSSFLTGPFGLFIGFLIVVFAGLAGAYMGPIVGMFGAILGGIFMVFLGILAWWALAAFIGFVLITYFIAKRVG